MMRRADGPFVRGATGARLSKDLARRGHCCCASSSSCGAVARCGVRATRPLRVASRFDAGRRFSSFPYRTLGGFFRLASDIRTSSWRSAGRRAALPRCCPPPLSGASRLTRQPVLKSARCKATHPVRNLLKDPFLGYLRREADERAALTAGRDRHRHCALAPEEFSRLRHGRAHEAGSPAPTLPASPFQAQTGRAAARGRATRA